MGNVREINVHECDIIRKIRENFVSRTFPRIRYRVYAFDVTTTSKSRAPPF